jgi:indolepyruvate ferredoxin oxidoreductase beta subunit
LGLEPVETLRVIDFLSSEGVVVVNTNPVLPVSALSGRSQYPEIETILTELSRRCKTVVAIDAESLAIKAGHALTSNVVMIGALSNYLPLTVMSLEASISRIVPSGTVDVNISAFRLGRGAIE